MKGALPLMKDPALAHWLADKTELEWFRGQQRTEEESTVEKLSQLPSMKEIKQLRESAIAQDNKAAHAELKLKQLLEARRNNCSEDVKQEIERLEKERVRIIKDAQREKETKRAALDLGATWAEIRCEAAALDMSEGRVAMDGLPWTSEYTGKFEFSNDSDDENQFVRTESQMTEHTAASVAMGRKKDVRKDKGRRARALVRNKKLGARNSALQGAIMLNVQLQECADQESRQ